MKKGYTILLLTLFVTITSCAGSMHDLNRNDKKIARQAKARFDQFWTKINDNDLEGIDDFFSTNERFTWMYMRGINNVDDRTEFKNPAEACDWLLNSYEPNKAARMKKITGHVSLLNQSYVNVFVMYKQVVKDASGKKVHFRGSYNVDLYKENDTWRFLAGFDQRMKLEKKLKSQ